MPALPYPDLCPTEPTHSSLKQHPSVDSTLHVEKKIFRENLEE